MKAFFATLTLLLCLSASAADSTYTFKRALSKRLIKAEIRGVENVQPNSSHNYGQCMQMKLTNLTTQQFNVKLEAGQQLVPGDTTVQTMLVTEGKTFSLKSRSSVQEYINAMCMQMHDAAPVYKHTFSAGEMSKGNMLTFAQLLEKQKYFDSTAQYALWCLTDNVDIKAIKGSDTNQVKQLQKFVSEATGQPVPEYYKGKLVVKANATFEWGASEDHTATLVIMNSKNQVVKNVLKDEKLTTGYHTYNVELSTIEYTPGTYTIKLFLNGKLQSTEKVKLEASE